MVRCTVWIVSFSLPSLLFLVFILSRCILRDLPHTRFISRDNTHVKSFHQLHLVSMVKNTDSSVRPCWIVFLHTMVSHS